MKVLEEIVKKIIDKANKGTVLYENTTGSNTTITLNDSLSNYDYIEIEFYQSSGIFNTVRIKNNEKTNLSYILNGVVDERNYIQIGFNIIEVINNKINFLKGGYVNFYSNAYRNANFTNETIYIKRVVGYK